MCGIVGYVGSGPAVPFLLDGLKRLEYRGYDSAGVAVLHRDGGRYRVAVMKAAGRIGELEARLHGMPDSASIGIGHTRWATHGRPNDVNAHPHGDCHGRLAVVHNGIIENFQELRRELTEQGHLFQSDTDTEVIPHLIEASFQGDLFRAVLSAASRLRGAFAVAMISTDDPEMLIGVRHSSPLIVGLGAGENYLASDIPAVIARTRNALILEDGEVVALTRSSVEVCDLRGRRVDKKQFFVQWDAAQAERGGLPHFMLKEIYEQPQALRDTLRGRLRVPERLEDGGLGAAEGARTEGAGAEGARASGPEGSVGAGAEVRFPAEETEVAMKEDIQVILDEVSLSEAYVKSLKKIFMVACGTAYHACLVGKYLVESVVRLPVEVDLASEFRYRDPIYEGYDGEVLTVVVSQSGETADTLAALREGKRRGSRVLAITNVVGSSVAREAHDLIYTRAGPEIAVASTKAYTTQIEALALLALYMADLRFSGVPGRQAVPSDLRREMGVELQTLWKRAEEALKLEPAVKELAGRIASVDDVFFIGRGPDYASALEGQLKLKEISYIHAEAYAAGELKHGTLALITDGVPVMALCTQPRLFEKMVSNITEAKSRGGWVAAFVARSLAARLETLVDFVLPLPESHPLLMPVVTAIPLQLLAYHAACIRGCDVDKPRNLAKSVTVE